MSENEARPVRRVPGPVIFAAILDFISVSFLGFLSLIALAGLIFGNIFGLYDFILQQMTLRAPSPNFSYGVTFILGAALAFCFSFVLFFVFLGIGLLRGKRLAWYLQVAVCVPGLFAFPGGTVINGLILFFFFRQSTRDFFKV